MAKIAISYRRSDSQDITGRIFDRLVQHYGKDTVFRDIDSIQPGIDFRTQIAAALGTTDVLLVVVGPAWLGRGKDAASRMDNAADPVRIEVETALKRDIPIIPVLVGGMRTPEVNELPESLRDFAYRHAVTADSGRDFDHHMDGLIRALDRIAALQSRSGGKAPRRLSPALYGIVGGLAVAAVVLGVVLLRRPPPPPAVAQQPQGQATVVANNSPTNNSPAGIGPTNTGPANSSAVSSPPPSSSEQIHITPTFNCAKGENEDEQAICHNSELMVLDQRLDAVYSSTRGRLDAEKRKTLAADENVWIAQRHSCKSDVGCIRDAYLKRIKILQAWQ